MLDQRNYKPLSEPVITYVIDAFVHHSASMIEKLDIYFIISFIS